MRFGRGEEPSPLSAAEVCGGYWLEVNGWTVGGMYGWIDGCAKVPNASGWLRREWRYLQGTGFLAVFMFLAFCFPALHALGHGLEGQGMQPHLGWCVVQQQVSTVMGTILMSSGATGVEVGQDHYSRLHKTRSLHLTEQLGRSAHGTMHCHCWFRFHPQQ